MPGVWTRKPPAFTPINWGHPLTRGLISFLEVNERAGTVVDAVTRAELTAFGGAVWGQDSAGPGAYCNVAGTANGFAVTAPPSIRIQPPITIMFYANILGTISTGANLFGVTYDDFGSPPYGAYYVYTDSSGIPHLKWGASDLAFPSTFNSRGPSWVAGTVLGSGTSGAKVYVDDPYTVAASASGAWTSAYAATAQYAIGTVTSLGATRNPNYLFNYGAIWNRILSASELVQSRTNIWQIMQTSPRRSRIGFTAAASAVFPLNLFRRRAI